MNAPDPTNPHAEVLGGAEPRNTCNGGASSEADLRSAPQDEEVGGSAPRLRAARRADLPVIMAMLADDILGRDREGGADEVVAAAFAEIERDPNSTIWVIERDGQVIGCAQLTCIAGLSQRGMKRGLIEAVRIASEARGGGLGRWFVGGLIGKARAAGCGVVQLTSDKRRTDAHRFYENLGFARSHEGFKLRLI